MSGMVRDLKAAGYEVSKKEHVLNVIRALLDENEHWTRVKLVMAHNENIQTFGAISKSLKMEKERLKAYTPSNVAFVAKRNGHKGNRPYHSKKPKKGPRPPENFHVKGVLQ